MASTDKHVTMWLAAHSHVAMKNIAEKLASADFLDFKIRRRDGNGFTCTRWSMDKDNAAGSIICEDGFNYFLLRLIGRKTRFWNSETRDMPFLEVGTK